tara:strand:- start:49 stop:1524 length:1476 start_codon:yes stop_codon:yes gene_type:complete
MAIHETNILEQAGQYNLPQLDIISYKQQKDESAPRVIDIKGIADLVEIHEDILTNTLYGTVTVYDTQDIRSVFPLTGLERLSLVLNTPGLPGYDYRHETGTPFHIYKVDTITKVQGKDNAQFYQIFFCSPEMINNQLETVSKAYAGPIENAVNDIVKNKLKSKKPFYFENTATNAKYVIPSLKPLKAINYLASQSVAGKYHNAGYVFYETSKGFNFRSIESLMAMGGSAARPTRWTYKTQVQLNLDNHEKGQLGATGGQSQVKDVETRMQTIIKYDFDKQIDTLGNIMGGMYANRLVVHDAFNKTIKTHDFDYLKEFEKSFHTETIGDELDSKKHLLPDAQYNDTGKGLNEYPNSKKMVVTETSKVHNDYEFTPTKETLPKAISQQKSLQNLNLTMLVYGNTLLNAGDIIFFDQPLMRPTEKVIPNPYTSGRYLIVSVKHTVSLETGTHEMILQCMKDSVRTPYPIESDPLILGKDKRREINIYEQDMKTI